MSSTKTILKALAPFVISAGVILTGIASAIGASKAKVQIEEDKKEAENKGCVYSAKEAVKSAARYYAPAVISGAATIAIAFVSDGKHRKAEAALAGSATAIGAAFNFTETKRTKTSSGKFRKNRSTTPISTPNRCSVRPLLTLEMKSKPKRSIHSTTRFPKDISIRRFHRSFRPNIT